jgi:hypothetical protein
MEEKKKSVVKGNNIRFKLFIVFLIIVIIVSTAIVIINKNNDIEEGTKLPSIPNQAEAKEN